MPDPSLPLLLPAAVRQKKTCFMFYGQNGGLSYKPTSEYHCKDNYRSKSSDIPSSCLFRGGFLTARTFLDPDNYNS